MNQIRDYLYNLLYYYPNKVKDEYDVHSEICAALENEYGEGILAFTDYIRVINFCANYEGIYCIGYEWDIEIEDEICEYLAKKYPERFL